MPAELPERLRARVDGYDLAVPYQKWRLWIESRKGVAAEIVLAREDPIPGERAWGNPFLRFRKYSHDFGHFMTGEIQTVCRAKGGFEVDRGACHYRLRRAYIEPEAGAFRQDNPLSRWMDSNFDAAKLAAHLRKLGLGPETDFWSVENEALFSVLASPVPMLVENATLRRMDSRDCPAMAAAVLRMERSRLDWPLDLAGVGEDEKVQVLWPHSTWIEYELNIRMPEGGVGSISGRGRALERLVGPALNAADECEKQRGK